MSSPSLKTSKSTPISLKEMLIHKQNTMVRNPYITRDFQDYGYSLAEKLGDLKYKALYIKLARDYPRAMLESAYSYVADYPKANNRGKLFMWKLKQLKTPQVKSPVEENLAK